MITITKPLSVITQAVIAVLPRKIGVVNTVRPLEQFTGDVGICTEE